MGLDRLEPSQISLSECALYLPPEDRIIIDPSHPLPPELNTTVQNVVTTAENDLHRLTEPSNIVRDSPLSEARQLGEADARDITIATVEAVGKAIKETSEISSITVACPDISFRLIRRWIGQQKKIPQLVTLPQNFNGQTLPEFPKPVVKSDILIFFDTQQRGGHTTLLDLALARHKSRSSNSIPEEHVAQMAAALNQRFFLDHEQPTETFNAITDLLRGTKTIFVPILHTHPIYFSIYDQALTEFLKNPINLLAQLQKSLALPTYGFPEQLILNRQIIGSGHEAVITHRDLYRALHVKVYGSSIYDKDIPDSHPFSLLFGGSARGLFALTDYQLAEMVAQSAEKMNLSEQLYRHMQ